MERKEGQWRPKNIPKSQSKSQSIERGKPLGEGLANNPTVGKNVEMGGIPSRMREEIGGRKTTFECIVPKITLSPFDFLRTMYDEEFLKLPRGEWPEHVQELEQKCLQEWREEMRTSSREELQDILRKNKDRRDLYPKWSRRFQASDKFLQALDQENKEINEELRKRIGDW